MSHHFNTKNTIFVALYKTIKNTKIMKKIVSLLTLSIILSLTACSSDDEATKTEDTRFKSELVGDDKMEILIDTKTGLTWVNDIKGCIPGVVIPDGQSEALEFAGKDDWRTPTSAEQVELMKAIVERKMKLKYINANCAIMSSSDGVWVFTENSNSPGETTTTEPGNAGIRSVRKTN